MVRLTLVETDQVDDILDGLDQMPEEGWRALLATTPDTTLPETFSTTMPTTTAP